MLAFLPSVYVTFKLEPEPTTVYQGHTAMFQCQAEGDPVPHIQWKGKDKILDPGKLLPRYTASVPNCSVVQHGTLHAYPACRCQWCGLGVPVWGDIQSFVTVSQSLDSPGPKVTHSAKLQLSCNHFFLEHCTA